jgi:hypothetical protein
VSGRDGTDWATGTNPPRAHQGPASLKVEVGQAKVETWAHEGGRWANLSVAGQAISTSPAQWAQLALAVQTVIRAIGDPSEWS